MKSKSTTQKLNVRWQDRQWDPAIESRERSGQGPLDRVEIYETADRCDADDSKLVVRRRKVVRRTLPNSKQPWNN